MSKLKCRCGSDEKVFYDNESKSICRVSDKKPHVCLADQDKVHEILEENKNLKEANKGMMEQIEYLQVQLAKSNQ